MSFAYREFQIDTIEMGRGFGMRERIELTADPCC